MNLTTDLAPELVLRVLHFVDPATLVDLACSCRFLEKCTSGLLKKHRALHAQYRVYNDGNPQSITKVLRNALRDEDVAWHIRELGFYRIRTQWSHWTGSDDYEEAENAGLTDSSLPPDYAFTWDEQADLLDLLREVYYFDEQAIDKARADLEHGNDAPLKLLLIGVCPKIRTVKFSRNPRLAGKATLETEPSGVPENPRFGLEYLNQAIVNQLRNKSAPWPAGLNSVQDLAIGVDTENDPRNSTFKPSPSLFANCMHLPNLVSVYCFGLEMPWVRVDDQGETGARYEIENGSSSVQHLFLQGGKIYHNEMNVMIRGFKQLRSLTIAGGEVNDVDAIVEFSGECYRKSLETLMFYDTATMTGYRCNLCLPEYMNSLCSLRTIYVDANDVMLEAMGKYDGDVECSDENTWISDSEFFTRFCMDHAFPNSTEVLVLGTPRGRSDLFRGDADLWDQAITTMIEYGRVDGSDEGEDAAADNSGKPATTFEGRFPNLKAIYLDDLDNLYYNIDHPRSKRWFRKAIAAGRKFGVDVHTRTTRSRPFHRVDSHFPKPPMMTSHYFVEEVVFDIYKGKWLRPKCGNCGTCEKCLKQYDAGVWKEVEEDVERGRVS